MRREVSKVSVVPKFGRVLINECVYAIVFIAPEDDSDGHAPYLFWCEGMEFDFCKQPSHFPKEHPPTLRVFRRLERQERFFKLLQEFGQIGQFFFRHGSPAQMTT